MTESPLPRPGPVISVHRLEIRPGARLTDLRLLTTDRRRLRREPGLRYADTLICGSRAGHSLRLPPSARDRQVLAVWDDLASYDLFRAGPVMARWQDAGPVFSAVAEPFAARGDWFDRDPFPEVPRTGAADGPIMVITYAWIPARRLPSWHGRVVPKGTADFTTAPGLVAATVGGSLTSRRAQTTTFWTDSRSMIQAVYPRESAHGSQIEWGKQHLPRTSFARARLLSAEGTWLGGNPLSELLTREAR